MYGVGMDDTHVKIRGAPVLDEPALSAHQKMIADKLTVAELMSMAVVALPPVVSVMAITIVAPRLCPVTSPGLYKADLSYSLQEALVL
jgi:hypothetical protein